MSEVKIVNVTKLTANDASAMEDLGTLRRTIWGDVFEYNVVSEVVATAGTVTIPTSATDLDLLSSSTDRKTVTYSTGGLTAGAFSGFLLYINDGTGEGNLRRIKGNSATEIYLYTALNTDLAVASSDGEVWHPSDVKKVLTTTLIQDCRSVCHAARTDEYYGWGQVSGIGEVLVGEAATADTYLSPGDNTAGTLVLVTSGEEADDVTVVARSIAANTNADKTCAAEILMRVY